MIVGHLKPLEEIASSVKDFKKVLVLGCGTCVTVCLTGGQKEAEALARDLVHPQYFGENPPEFVVDTIERQCERDLLTGYLVIPEGVDAVLSLACGAGVQTLSAVYSGLPVLPALNTTFIGALDEPGVWREKCRGCGECVMAYTGGICPVTRCAKQLFNGPCGGSKNGRCEVNEDLDCGWALIIERLTAIGRLDLYERIQPPKDWSKDWYGPRKLVKKNIWAKNH